MTVDRRTLLTALAAGAMLAMPGWAVAGSDDPTSKPYALGDIPLGADDAPLTVIEYASLTCPHCAAFHMETWPKVKENYVDTGKVRFIIREVYFDQYGLWAAMTARCGGAKGYFPLIDTFLSTQNAWTRAPDVGAAIQQIGRRAGLSQEQLNRCLSDRDYAMELVKTYQDQAGADDVRSTPTFIIGGTKHSGRMPYDEFAALLDAELPD